MADEDVMAAARAAAQGDPQALADLIRQIVRDEASGVDGLGKRMDRIEAKLDQLAALLDAMSRTVQVPYVQQEPLGPLRPWGHQPEITIRPHTGPYDPFTVTPTWTVQPTVTDTPPGWVGTSVHVPPLTPAQPDWPADDSVSRTVVGAATGTRFGPWIASGALAADG